MGREIKRVPLDFKWPLNTVWEGFINPHYEGHCTKCTMCDGSGYSTYAKAMSEKWYDSDNFNPAENNSKPFEVTTAGIFDKVKRNTRSGVNWQSEARRLCYNYNRSWCHHLSQQDVDALWNANRLQFHFDTKPTPREVNLWSLSGLGHDSINQGVCVSARCVTKSVPYLCDICYGSGSVWDRPENKTKAENWEDIEPPAGEGYQLWETVTEGSPISPVFNSPEELADWLTSSPDYSWRRNDEGVSYGTWLSFIYGPGWAPSMVSLNNEVMSGVQASTLV